MEAAIGYACPSVLMMPIHSGRLGDDPNPSASCRVGTALSLSLSVGGIRFNTSHECAYDTSRLNFAIHVRLGDRKVFWNGDLEYFRLLDAFMDVVTKGVLDMGLPSPLFHVFSETLQPCPPPDTGIFPEFSAWPPVELDQVPAVCSDSDRQWLFVMHEKVVGNPDVRGL